VQFSGDLCLLAANEQGIMTDVPRYLELHCPACRWRSVCGPQSMARWLRTARKIRPGHEPEPEILVELFRSAAGLLACPECGQQGLTAAPAEEDQADWPEARTCESCGKPIPPERIEAVPGAVLCARCQEREEQGVQTVEGEYCPKCGSLMKLQLSRSGGVARYKLVCTNNPPCRVS